MEEKLEEHLPPIVPVRSKAQEHPLQGLLDELRHEMKTVVDVQLKKQEYLIKEFLESSKADAHPHVRLRAVRTQPIGHHDIHVDSGEVHNREVKVRNTWCLKDTDGVKEVKLRKSERKSPDFNVEPDNLGEVPHVHATHNEKPSSLSSLGTDSSPTSRQGPALVAECCQVSSEADTKDHELKLDFQNGKDARMTPYAHSTTGSGDEKPNPLSASYSVWSASPRAKSHSSNPNSSPSSQNEKKPMQSKSFASSRSETNVELRLTGLDEYGLYRDHGTSVLLKRYATENFSGRWQQAAFCLADIVGWFEDAQEPERTGWLPTVVFGAWFRNLCITCIGLNAVFIWFTTNYDMLHVGEANVEPKFQEIELAFVAFYTLEILLKFAVHRFYFFINEEYRWNLFDLSLVLFSGVEQVLVVAMRRSGSANLSFLRILRMLKIVKVLRLFRSLRFFSDLRLMMDCVLGSIVSLFWCLVMILFVLYVFAILMMQLLVMYWPDNAAGEDEEEILNLQIRFGSVEGTIVTLFQSTTGGLDWGEDVYKWLPASSPQLLQTCYLFYILFFVVAAWNVVTSTFVEKAFKLAQPDVETLMLEQLHLNSFHAKELNELFLAADVDQSSGISYDEFRALMEHPRFRSYLSVRGININDVDLFYKMLSSVSPGDEVDLTTLVNACLRMKGFATSIDLHALSFETKLMRKKVVDHSQRVMSRLSHIETALGIDPALASRNSQLRQKSPEDFAPPTS